MGYYILKLQSNLQDKIYVHFNQQAFISGIKLNDTSSTFSTFAT